MTADQHDGQHGGQHGEDRVDLLSPEADALYHRLLSAGPVTLGGGLTADTPAVVELVDRRFAVVLAGVIEAVAPERALRDTFESWQAATARSLQQLREAAPVLERLQELWERRAGPDSRLASVLTEPDVIGATSVDLPHEATSDVLTFTTGPNRRKPVKVVPPAAHLVERGVRFRAIWDTECWLRPEGPANAERCVAAGSVIRIAPTLPTKLIIVDDRVALVALTPLGADGALLVRSSTFVHAMRELFEARWATAVPCPPSLAVDETAGREPLWRQILALVASEEPDAVVARQLGISERTLRRHLAAMQEELGVSTRFGLALQAERRGLLS